MMPAQLEHRARIPFSGIFAGSTLNTVEHWGQVTFMISSGTAGVTPVRTTAQVVIATPAVGDEHRSGQ